MAAMLREFGEHWQVEQIDDGTFVAVERPGPPEPRDLAVVSGADLTELRKKLNARSARLEF